MENGKVFQCFSFEAGGCQIVCIENWDAIWDTVLHGIQMVCLTLNQHGFSTCFSEFQNYVGGPHKQQQLNHTCSYKDRGKVELSYQKGA